MTCRQTRIAEAIDTVREIEEVVRQMQFPAWDASTINEHPDINSRFRVCVDRVVRIYCAHTSLPFIDLPRRVAAHLDGVADMLEHKEIT